MGSDSPPPSWVPSIVWSAAMDNGLEKTPTVKALSLPWVNLPIPIEKKVVIFGAGGAARNQRGSGPCRSQSYYHRQPFDRAGEELTKLLQTSFHAMPTLPHGNRLTPFPKKPMSMINATSIGLFPDVDARLILISTP